MGDVHRELLFRPIRFSFFSRPSTRPLGVVTKIKHGIHSKRHTTKQPTRLQSPKFQQVQNKVNGGLDHTRRPIGLILSGSATVLCT